MAAAGRGTVLILCSLFAGCFSVPDAAVEDPYEEYTEPVVLAAEGVMVGVANATTYYYIALVGSENATRLSGKGSPPPHNTCTSPWRFTSHRWNQTVEYNKSEYEVPTARILGVIGQNLWGVKLGVRSIADGCPTDYGLKFVAPTPSDPHPRATIRLGAFGQADITTYGSGQIVFEGRDPEVGDDARFVTVNVSKRLVVSYARIVEVGSSSYYVQGGFELVNRGVWPREGLLSQSSGLPTRESG